MSSPLKKLKHAALVLFRLDGEPVLAASPAPPERG
jgi:hypothetical protein